MAVFNGPHPETGEELEVVDQRARGLPAAGPAAGDRRLRAGLRAGGDRRDRPEAAQGRRPAGQGHGHRGQRRQRQRRLQGQGQAHLGVEAEAEAVERPQPEAAAAVVAVGRREPVARELDRRRSAAARAGTGPAWCGRSAGPRGLGVACRRAGRARCAPPKRVAATPRPV